MTLQENFVPAIKWRKEAQRYIEQNPSLWELPQEQKAMPELTAGVPETKILPDVQVVPPPTKLSPKIDNIEIKTVLCALRFRGDKPS